MLINPHKLEHMLHLQVAVNNVIAPDWRTAEFPFYRAIWVECAELLDHHGFKWWKSQVPDVEQVKVELVDIFHFMLSDIALNPHIDYSLGEIINDLEIDSYEHSVLALLVDDNALETIESFIGEIVEVQKVTILAVHIFWLICDKLELSFDELYKLYLAKNVLNTFRQNHGYATGDYVKVWYDKEDNEHMMDIVRTLADDAFDNDDIMDLLYDELSSVYTTVA